MEALCPATAQVDKKLLLLKRYRVVCEKGAATSQGQSSPDCVTVMVDVCFSLLHAIIKKLDHS